MEVIAFQHNEATLSPENTLRRSYSPSSGAALQLDQENVSWKKRNIIIYLLPLKSYLILLVAK